VGKCNFFKKEEEQIMRKTLKKIAAAVSASVLLTAVAVTAMPNTADAVTVVSKAGKKAGKAKFDPEGTYHAYFGLQQTQTWIFRDPWYSETLGIDGTSFEGTDCTFNDFLQSGDDGLVKLDATVTDAEITGNGFYTVSLENINNGLATTDPNSVLAMIYVDTDIPVSAKDMIQISDVKLYMDDIQQTLPEELFYNWEEEEESKLIRFDVVNSYQKEQGYYEGSPSVIPPSNSIKITFKISGMAKDNPDAVEPTPTPVPEKNDSEAADNDNNSSSDSGGLSPVLIGGIVVVILVVIGGVIVVTKKKK